MKVQLVLVTIFKTRPALDMINWLMQEKAEKDEAANVVSKTQSLS